MPTFTCVPGAREDDYSAGAPVNGQRVLTSGIAPTAMDFVAFTPFSV